MIDPVVERIEAERKEILAKLMKSDSPEFVGNMLARLNNLEALLNGHTRPSVN